MNGSGESPTFAMFCTFDCPGSVFLFAEVADEIGAVRAFHEHVAVFGQAHVPLIHMEPMRDGWHFGDVDPDNIDPARNLFRAPAEAAPMKAMAIEADPVAAATLDRVRADLSIEAAVPDEGGAAAGRVPVGVRASGRGRHGPRRVARPDPLAVVMFDAGRAIQSALDERRHIDGWLMRVVPLLVEHWPPDGNRRWVRYYQDAAPVADVVAHEDAGGISVEVVRCRTVPPVEGK